MKNKSKLSFKKNVISNLQAKSIQGGAAYLQDDSSSGCTGNDDETMTCGSWSCTC